jgi:predicted nuclease with TOPRIM domain
MEEHMSVIVNPTELTRDLSELRARLAASLQRIEELERQNKHLLERLDGLASESDRLSEVVK